MNLLPKSHEEFKTADYWNTFFKKRGKKVFEWYGEYPELCSYLFKYIKHKDDILVVGCGNSTLSMNLYDAGYKNMINIDISEVVIKQMREWNRSKRPDLPYEVMDVTKMTYSDEKFSVVLDKGTLDAIMPDITDTTLEVVDKFFQEIHRVLRNGGRFVCISLLQEHILKKLVSYFPTAGFMFRVSRCIEAEMKTKEEEGSTIPVFIVVATKFNKLSQPVLEIALDNGPPRRVQTVEEIIFAVNSTQESALICNTLYKRSVADVGEVSLDLYRPGETIPRYTLYVVDESSKRKKTYATFIVPQGRESDWLFSTKEGRQHLLKSTQRDRLAVVVLRREHKFDNMEAVKKEINDSVINLAPIGLGANEIPFLSLGSDVGKRLVCCEGTSEVSGAYVVEEIEDENSVIYRRLLFLNNQFTIQSEARIKITKSRRGNIKKIVDPGFLACEHHISMSLAVSSLTSIKTDREALVIGLGGGGLCTFLAHCFPKLRITAVEIDKEMLKIATEYFGLIQTENLKVEIEDGIKFLLDSAENQRKFDAILFDVDNKDVSLGMSCPPKQFIEYSVLNTVVQTLTNDGLFILNLVVRNQALRQDVIDNLKNIFKFVSSCSLESDVNEVIISSMNSYVIDEWNNRMKTAAINLNKQANEQKLSTDDLINVSKIFETFSIEK